VNFHPQDLATYQKPVQANAPAPVLLLTQHRQAHRKVLGAQSVLSPAGEFPIILALTWGSSRTPDADTWKDLGFLPSWTRSVKQGFAVSHINQTQGLALQDRQ
jgi:hypothetical protein